MCCLRRVNILKTNPLNIDSDNDGIVDSFEDSDSDGLSDLDELKFVRDRTGPVKKTDPMVADTDGDSLSDGFEVNILGTNPLKNLGTN